MKKPILAKFLEFKHRHNLSNSVIQNMMTEYANSGPDTARSYFMNKYSISEHVFYRCRDFAIICMLVDGRTQKRLFKKAAFNSQEHNAHQSSRKSISYSEKLLMQREQFFNSFSRNDIEDICNKYAEGLPLAKIASSYETGIFCIKNLLRKGIILGYVDEPTFAAISLRVRLMGRNIEEVFRK